MSKNRDRKYALELASALNTLQMENDLAAEAPGVSDMRDLIRNRYIPSMISISPEHLDMAKKWVASDEPSLMKACLGGLFGPKGTTGLLTYVLNRVGGELMNVLTIEGVAHEGHLSNNRNFRENRVLAELAISLYEDRYLPQRD